MDWPRLVDLAVVLIAWSRFLVGVLLANVIRTDVFVLSLTRNVLFSLVSCSTSYPWGLSGRRAVCFFLLFSLLL